MSKRIHYLSHTLGYILCGICFLVFGGITSVVHAYPGCTAAGACNYDAGATIDDGSCVICDVFNNQICDEGTACCYDLNSNSICDYDEICSYPPGHGCTNALACNYDPLATTDVGSCVICPLGNTCASSTSCCDDPDNNGVCGDQGVNNTDVTKYGCVISTACNFDATADANDGSCVFPKCDVQWCPEDTEPEPFMDDCGVCDADVSNDNTTCDPTCTPGTSCNDNNESTINDLWNAGCVCLGTLVETDCNGEVGGPATAGTSCDDGDTATIDDVWNDSCVCEGLALELDCNGEAGGPALTGTSCDEDDIVTSKKGSNTLITNGNANSEGGGSLGGDNNEFPGNTRYEWNDSCVCEGTTIDVDCNGEAEGPATVGTTCDDGDGSTIDDVWNDSCECIGIAVEEDSDCNGIVGGPALPGTACNDGDATTMYDVWNNTCSCEGQVVQQLDCMSVLGGTDLPGNACDDGDSTTVNDIWNINCECIGAITTTPDCTGTYGGNALPGVSCDDGDDLTIDDAWNDTCSCEGELSEHTAADEEDDSPVVGEDDEEEDYPTVAGSIYVDFEDPLLKKDFEDVMKEFGIDDVYQPFENLGIDTYRIDFDPSISHDEFIAALKEKFGDKVTFTEPTPLIQINFPLIQADDLLVQTIPDYLEQIGYTSLLDQCSYLFTTQQKEIRVAIIDNGYAVHDDLWENVVYTYDAADKDADVSISEITEACSHGNVDAGLVGAVSTNEIGIISAGYNPKLVLIKATPDGKPCTDISAGIEGLSIAAEHADIINISRGVDFDSKVLKNVIQKILEKGVVIVAAAGNFDTDKKFYPAAYDGVIAVGAVDKNNDKAHFSNYGDRVDIAAPGVDMLSTALANGYAKVSGTSQSAPLTAGWLAFLMSHGLGVDELYTYLAPIDRNDLGRGIIDPASYCQDLCKLDYTYADFDYDGVMTENDLVVLQSRVDSTYMERACDETFSTSSCCPTGTICDIDDSGAVDETDFELLGKIINETTFFEICADGIDNNCDGVVDCEEHGIAPLVATTASIGNNRFLGIVLIIVLILAGGGVLWVKKDRFLE